MFKSKKLKPCLQTTNVCFLRFTSTQHPRSGDDHLLRPRRFHPAPEQQSFPSAPPSTQENKKHGVQRAGAAPQLTPLKIKLTTHLRTWTRTFADAFPDLYFSVSEAYPKARYHEAYSNSFPPLFSPLPTALSTFTLHVPINILPQPFPEDAAWEKVWSMGEMLSMQDTLNIRRSTQSS